MIISAKTLITGDGKTVLTDGGVLVAEGRIAAVDKTDTLLQAYPNEQHIDYGAATILPGLIDMHVHLGFYSSRHDAKLYTDHLVAYLALKNAQRFLVNGVTTVRDIFGPHGACRQLAYAASSDLVRAPRIFYCNQALTVSGGIDWSLDGTVQVDGPEEIRKVVREQIRTGATWVKAMCDARTPGLAEFDQDELNMIVKETHRRGCKAAAHANMQPAVQMCINAGFDTIEHACHITVEQAKEMAEKGLAIVSTSYVYEYLYDLLKDLPVNSDALYKNEKEFLAFRSNIEAYKQNYQDVYKTGVVILAGTDCPFDGVEHITVAWEMECMVKYCGMTPVQAISTATSNPAKVLDMQGQIGILAVGAIADILVADANADKDISSLKRVKDVYQSGRKVCLEAFI